MTTEAAASTFLVGGARSGKSTLAQRLAVASGLPVTIVVTAEASDQEMEERIRRHQADRPDGWLTVEEPLDVERALAEVPAEHCVVVDCLTLWLTNLLFAGRTVADIEQEVGRLASALIERTGPVIVVSNEVGLGIVPGDPLSRSFRDIQGRCNQQFAGRFDRALFVAAGRVVPLADPKTVCEELN